MVQLLTWAMSQAPSAIAPQIEPAPVLGGDYIGKDLVIRREFEAEAEIADIPDVGTRISQGRPVLTVLTEAPDESSLMAKLQSRIAEIERFLYSDVPNDSSSPAVPKQPGC